MTEKPKRKNRPLTFGERLNDIVLLAKHFEYETDRSPAECVAILESLSRTKSEMPTGRLIRTQSDDENETVDFRIVYTPYHGRNKRGSQDVSAVGRVFYDYGQEITRVVGKVVITGWTVFSLSLSAVVFLGLAAVSEQILFVFGWIFLGFMQLIRMMNDFDSLYNSIFDLFKGNRKRKSKSPF